MVDFCAILNPGRLVDFSVILNPERMVDFSAILNLKEWGILVQFLTWKNGGF
jgi:hypothetical protein